jgi:organic hydroperoxide reductase OsmC/OhrA
MAEYLATITWQCTDHSFAARKYSRRHEWRFDGGTVLAASSSPHVVPVPYSDPGAVDPEEAFVASLSSCHMLWFLDIASQAGWVVTDYRDEAVGVMGKNAQGKLAMLKVTLRPAVRFADKSPSREEIENLHHKAHASCFLASSVLTNVVCEPA